MEKRTWLALIAGSALFGLLIGCGGGGETALTGGGTGGETGFDLTEQATARVDVDLAGGTATVTAVGQNPQSKSLYTGSAVSVGASLVSTDQSELTIQKIKLQITNNTSEAIGTDGSQMIVDRVSTGGAFPDDFGQYTTVSTIIGPGVSSADGPGQNVTIVQPNGIDRDTDGTIYVSGFGDATLRKFKDNYVTRIGTGISSSGGLAVLPGQGLVFLTEQSTHNVVRVPTSGGAKFVIAGGGASGLVDGSGAAARFNAPRDIAIFGTSAYVADFSNDRIRKIDNLTGGAGNVTTLNVFPVIPRPSGLGVMSHNGVNWLVVTSTQTHRVYLVNIANGQSFTIAGTGVVGSADGFGNAATFNTPSDAAAVGSTIFVAELGGRRVRQLMLKSGAEPRFATSWIVKYVAGDGISGAGDGQGVVARFAGPRHIAADGSGALLVTDISNNRVRKVTPTSGTLPITGPGGSGAGGVMLANPDSFILDPANAGNRKGIFDLPSIAPKGAIGSTIEKTVEFTVAEGTTIFTFFVSVAGNSDSVGALDAVLNTGSPLIGSPNVNVRTLTGGPTGLQDGDPSVARFGSLGYQLAATDAAVYIPDFLNNCVRRYDLQTKRTTTIAGLTPVAFTAVGGTGLTSSLPYASAVWMNKTETEGFVTLEGDQYIVRLSRTSGDPSLASSWTVSLIVGTGTGGLTNGAGDVAQVGTVLGIAADESGSTFYFTDYTNHQVRVAKILGNANRTVAANWTVSSFVGSPGGTLGDDDGTGGSATFRRPSGIVLAKDGNFYITEYDGYRVRRITPGGVVTRLAGSSTAESGVADGLPNVARFEQLLGIVTDNSGYLYIGDRNNLVRRVSIATGETRTVAGNSGTTGSSDGFGNAATLEDPEGLAFVPGKGLFVFTGSRLAIIERIVRNGQP